MKHDQLIIGNLPDAVRACAEKAGLPARDVLFSLQSDLTVDARPCRTWLVVTRTRIASFSVEADKVEVERGPFDIAAITKVRVNQTVGSAFLQVMIDGLFVDVIRFSNAHRDMFGRVRTLLEGMIAGKPADTAPLTLPLDTECPTCGLPLATKGGRCRRCESGHGILARALALMKPYRRYIVFLLAMMILRVGVGLVPPFLTRTLVDKVLQAKEHLDWLKWIMLGLVSVSATQCLLNITIGRTSSFVGTRITKELREMLMRRLLSLSVDYYNKNPVGSLMSRVLYDADYFHSFVNQVAEGFLLNVMMVIGIGVMLFTMKWQLAFLVLLPIPLVIIGTMFFWKYIYPRYYRVWDSQSKMAQLINGLIQGVRLVKSFGQEEREMSRFSESAHYMRASRRSLEMSAATFHPLMAFVFSLGGLIVWYAGGNLVFRDRLTLGTLMAFFAYLGMFYQPISALSMFSNWMTGFLAAGQRVFEVLDATVTIREPEKPVRLAKVAGAVELRNVTFGYDPYNPVLKNVSLRIEPGQFVGIVGKSGSGKTTLVNLICRFYDVQQGEVLLDGVDVRSLALEDIHRSIGLVLQDPFLFRARIRDNIVYGRPDAPDTDVVKAARAANAHDFIARMPFGYDHRLEERGAGLSGGERQRVTIARALISDPRILILDEATSSVDTESEQEIQKALAAFGRGRTTIAIAHRLSTLKNSDYIYVLDNGSVAEHGTHEALMAHDGIYANLVRIQTELTRLEMD